MNSINSIDLEVLKVTSYRGKPYTLHYRTRKTVGTRSHANIPYEWIQGAIRLNMTKIFSATFQKWYTLRFDENKHLYLFNRSAKDTGYSVIEEIVLAVEKVNTEYYLLGNKP